MYRVKLPQTTKFNHKTGYSTKVFVDTKDTFVIDIFKCTLHDCYWIVLYQSFVDIFQGLKFEPMKHLKLVNESQLWMTKNTQLKCGVLFSRWTLRMTEKVRLKRLFFMKHHLWFVTLTNCLHKFYKSMWASNTTWHYALLKVKFETWLLVSQQKRGSLISFHMVSLFRTAWRISCF